MTETAKVVNVADLSTASEGELAVTAECVLSELARRNGVASSLMATRLVAVFLHAEMSAELLAKRAGLSPQ